jgi:dethiobiotin synthetase
MSKRYFITSSGTGIGKTFVTSLLTRQLRARGASVAAYKPVISGYSDDDATTDTAELLRALELPYTPQNVQHVSPWRFAAPLSPNMAAAREGRELSLDALVNHGRTQESQPHDVLLVEGVGGVLVPLNNTHTVCDWMVALGYPAILVGGSYLGSISHTLSAAEVLKTRGIALHAVVISESQECPVPPDETIATLKHFLPAGVPVVLLPRASHGTIAADITLPNLAELVL